MNVPFAPPGPGTWELEQTHFARPATRYAGAIVPAPIMRGFGEGTKRYGLLLDTMQLAMVNDFCYAQFRPVGAPKGASGTPPRPLFTLLTWLHPEIRRRIRTGAQTIQKKLWREDMRRWDEEYKPDSIARNTRLQNVEPAALSDSEFLAHLDAVGANFAEMLYRHHIFTIPSSFPVGHFLVEVQGWTGLSSGEVLGVLKGAAPVSRGIGADALAAARDALASAGIADATHQTKPGQQVLDDLRSTAVAGEHVQRFLDVVGYRLVSGYDVGDKYALEMPDMLVRTLFGAPDTVNRQAEFARRRDALRAKVPEHCRPRFDELLEEARFIHRLRDERGMYNDLWAAGLARRALLEAGRRLRENGVLPDAMLAVNASHDELVALLTGAGGPDADELRRRGDWRNTRTLADAPAFLGPPPQPPPPVEWLPEPARPNARAVNTIIRELFNVSERQAAPKSVAGIPVHPGIYRGPARIVNDPQDFNRLRKGDVLVARTTGPAFNVVLPLLGAIVTDRGGQLSHAAIVAREYGIPAVVGTRDATKMFADGAMVCVNGDSGVVELVQ